MGFRQGFSGKLSFQGQTLFVLCALLGLSACRLNLFSSEKIESRRVEVVTGNPKAFPHMSFLDTPVAHFLAGADFVGTNVADVGAHVVDAANPLVELHSLNDINQISRTADSVSFSTTLPVRSVWIELAAFLTANGAQNEKTGSTSVATNAITGVWGRGALLGGVTTTSITASTTSITLNLYDLVALGKAQDYYVKFCHNYGEAPANGKYFETGTSGQTCVDKFGSGSVASDASAGRIEVADAYYPWKALSSGAATFENLLVIPTQGPTGGPRLRADLSGGAYPVTSSCGIDVPSTFSGLPAGQDTLFLFVKHCSGSGPQIPMSGLWAWYKADSCYDGGTCTGTWRDDSGSGNHATVPSSPANPGWNSTAGPNSKPAVTFDGAADYLSLPTTLNANAYTILLVGRYTAAGTYPRRIVSASDGSNILFIGNDANYFSYNNNANNVSSATTYDTSWHSHVIQFNGTTLTARKDRSSVGSTSSSAIGTLSSFFLGKDGSYVTAAQVSEVIIYSRSLSSSEITQVESYINSKYGL